MTDPTLVAYVILMLVTAQRLGELWLSRRNTKHLLVRGGREVGARHFPLFFALHGGWLLALGVWVWAGPPQINLLMVVLYLLLQMGRVWVIRTLGAYWTTRIIVVDHAPLIQTGPYRFTRHPNYLIVCLEIVVLPLAFGAWWIAGVFSVLNTALIVYRIGIEDAANRGRVCVDPDGA